MKKIAKKGIGILGLAVLCLICSIAVQKTVKAETQIPLGDTWTSSHYNGDDPSTMHRYWFTIPSDGKVTVTCQASSNNYSWHFYLYNKDFTERYDYSEYNDSEVSITEYLKAGTYGVEFNPRYSDAVGDYKIKVEFTAVECNVPEPNDDFLSATPISLEQLQKGLLTDTNTQDYFMLQLSYAATLRMVTTGESSRYVRLYDKDFVEIESDYGSGAWWFEESVSPGTYYIEVERRWDYNTPYTLKCMVNQYVTDIHLKTSQLVMDKGKSADLFSSVEPADASQKTLQWSTSDSSVATVSAAGKVTARSVGYAIITAVTTDGTNISRQAAVIVRPEKASIKKLKRSRYNSRQLTIEVKPQKNANYQYQYSKNKTFKKAKSIRSSYTTATTPTLSKKKKYYVRVRAYYIYRGKLYYGAWSKVKSIYTKK